MMKRVRLLAYGLGAALLALGLISLGSAALLWAKAELSTPLMAHAFKEGKRLEQAQKPWPWADHTVQLKLTLQKTGAEIWGLSGDGMRAMAFGPVTYRQGKATIMVAHRDSHFRPLQYVQPGDLLALDPIKGPKARFRVTRIWTAHKDQLYLPEAGHQKGLLLITCYPFDAAEAGGPLRYLIWAEAGNIPEPV